MEEAFIGGCCNQFQLAPLLDGTSGAPTALRACDFVQWPQVLLQGLQASTAIIDAASYPYPDQGNARRHTTTPAPMMFYLDSFQTLIIIFTLVCFPALPHPRVRVAVAEAVWQLHHGPQPQQPNTTLPLALLHASLRPRDYLIRRSFGRTFSRLVLHLSIRAIRRY